MPTVKNSLGEGTQSVLLTAAILEQLAFDGRPLSVSRLAREIDTSKSRIFRHLQTLASCDFVTQDENTGGYTVGSRLLAICNKVGNRIDLLSIATPILQTLRKRTGHTAIIARVDPEGVCVLESFAADAPITLAVREGTYLPFERSAQGMVAMAFASSDQLTAGGALADAAGHYEAEHPGILERIRQQGWAQAGMRAGLSGKAAPVLQPDGRLVATVALLDTADAMSLADSADLGHLLDAAGQIAKALGRIGL